MLRCAIGPGTPLSAAAMLVAVLAAGVSSANAQPQPTHPNLIYATLGGQPLRLDLYLPGPHITPPYPCIINIHGGGWSGGSRYPIHSVSANLLHNGFAIASVSYRLTSQAALFGPSVPVTFPAQIHDVKGATRWLRANARAFDLDPARFGSFGTSAGGHLSALLGTAGNVAALEGSVGGNLEYSSRVQAAADYFGPTDILNINLDVTLPPGSTINHDAPTSPESRLVGWDDPGQGIGDIRANLASADPPYPALVALCHQVNPITFVSPDDPRFFIAHGTSDTAVPLNQSARLASALAAIAHPHTYIAVNGAGHGNLGPATNEQTVAFFRRVLRRPGDVNTSGRVDADDLITVILSWGACPPGASSAPPPCLADIAPHATGNGAVDVDDLIAVIVNWG